MQEYSEPIHNRVKYAFDHFSKPYLNSLSPGCWMCGKGTWACVFISHSCTRHCFFCLREQNEARDFVPYVERDIKFDSVERFIQYLRSFHFEGVSFSGGEPFMKFDLMYEYVRAIRDAFGAKHYIWVYTNGDPVNQYKLTRLVEAGLNEIRFDISAREYDLGPVSLALDHVSHVTVEIPAIPEDVERVKSLLPHLEAMGVKNINLHQLMVNDYNQGAFQARGYTEVHDDRYNDWFGILESESAALEILNHAAQRNMRLGINYCSRLYKYLFQLSGFRRRYVPLCRSDNDEITPTGYLRRLTTSECSDSDGGSIDLLHPEGDPVKVNYYAPWLASEDNEAAMDSCVTPLAEYRACVGKGLSAEFELVNQTARLFFQLLFVEKYDLKAAYEEVAALFGAGYNQQSVIYSELQEFHRRFATYEYIPYRILA